MLMRTIGMLLGLLWYLAGFSQSEDAALRIMTYNIHHGAGTDDVLDLERQAAIIRNAAPDVVGLQEVDSVVKRSDRTDQTAELARALGMYGTFGPAIPLTGGKYGVAILSRERPLSVRNIPLPGKEARTLLVCEFNDYVFANTHLDLDEDNRLASLAIIADEAARWDKPFFICGDWNDKPNSALISRMLKAFTFLSYITDATSHYTFPAGTPTAIIDYIALYGRMAGAVKSQRVLHEPVASDHRPVLVEVKLDRITAVGAPSEPRQQATSGLYDLAGRRIAAAAAPRGVQPKGIYIIRSKRRKVVL